MRRGVLVFVASVALVAVAVACSGDKSAKDKWIDSVRAACDERAHTIEVASAQLTAQSTAEQFAAFFAQFFEPAYRKQLQAMSDAVPPDDAARTLVSDTTAVLDAMAANPGAYAVAPDPFADVDVQWDAYGLKECGTRT